MLARHIHVSPILAFVMMLAVTLGLVPCVSGAKNETRPASVKFVLSSSGIAEIQSLVNPIITAAVSSAQIPEIRVHALGIYVTVSNITVNAFSLGDEVVDLIAPGTVSISTAKTYVEAGMAWRYHDGLIDIRGTAKDIMNKTEIGINIALDAADGHLVVQIADISVDVKQFEIILDGGHGGIYQDIVNLIKDPLKNTFENIISKQVKSSINELLSKYIPEVPVVLPFGPKVELDYALINSSSRHALVGTHYSNNHFSGDKQGVEYTSFSIDIGAYNSIDVAGYFRPLQSGQYAFQIYFNQAAQIDVPGGSAGHLEMHNPGMCWVQHHTDTTPYFNVTGGDFYPVRLRYQGGCGGGHVEIRLCPFNASCEALHALNVTSNVTLEMPLLVRPDAILTASGAEFFNRELPSEAPFQHVPLPTDLLPSFNVSKDMIALYVDPFLFSSVLSVLTDDGSLDFSVNDTSLPPSVHKYIQLNTTFFKLIFPELYKRFPNDMMQVDGTPTAVKAFKADSTAGLSFGMTYQLNVSVLQGIPTPTKIPAMVISISFNESTAVTVKNQSIVVHLGQANFTLQLEWSIVPVANISALSPIISSLLDDVIIPALNDLLAPGIPLPLLGPFQIVYPSVKYYDEGFIEITGAVKPINGTRTAPGQTASNASAVLV